MKSRSEPRTVVGQSAADAAKDAEIARLTAERDAALAGAVKVKPLVWKWSDAIRGYTADCRITRNVFSVYESNGEWAAGSQLSRNSGYPSKEAAMATMDAEHEARILAAIQPDPDARQAALAKVFCMGRDAAADVADEIAMGLRDNEYGDCADGAEEAADAIRALTPPADLAAKIGGEE